MEAKKLTKVQQVKNLLAVDPTISIKSVASALGITEAYAGTLLWKAKGGKKATRKVTSTPARQVERMATTPRGDAQTMKALEAENAKLHGWCLEWREKCDKLEESLLEAKNKYADTRAVIYYLESKIAQLIK